MLYDLLYSKIQFFLNQLYIEKPISRNLAGENIECQTAFGCLAA